MYSACVHLVGAEKEAADDGGVERARDQITDDGHRDRGGRHLPIDDVAEQQDVRADDEQQEGEELRVGAVGDEADEELGQRPLQPVDHRRVLLTSSVASPRDGLVEADLHARTEITRDRTGPRLDACRRGRLAVTGRTGLLHRETCCHRLPQAAARCRTDYHAPADTH